MKTALTLQWWHKPLGVYEQYTTYSSQIHWDEVQLCNVRVSQYCFFPLRSLRLKLYVNFAFSLVTN